MSRDPSVGENKGVFTILARLQHKDTDEAEQARVNHTDTNQRLIMTLASYHSGDLDPSIAVCNANSDR